MDGFNVPQAYEMYVLNAWELCGELNRFYRTKQNLRVIRNKETGKVEKVVPDNSEEGRLIISQYVAALTDLWGEMKDKVDGCNNEELVKAFYGEGEEFKAFYFTPSLIYEQPDKIFQLHLVLKRVLEAFKITRFEVR
jgi:hypothetical protein